MKTFSSLFILSFIVFGCGYGGQQEEINIAGKWAYTLSHHEANLSQKPFNLPFRDSLTLPGSLRDNNIGHVPGLTTPWTGSIYDSSWYFNPEMEKYRTSTPPKFPFWLTPDRYYRGNAYFQKEINIPEGWRNRSLQLFLERPHWQTKVWVDSIFMGQCNSLSTPHTYLVGADRIQPGKHLLTVQVDNAIRDVDPGINSHSISDHTQGNWNGIVGAMKLYPVNSIHIKQVKLTPDLSAKKVNAEITVSNLDELAGFNVRVLVKGYNHDHTLKPFTTKAKGKILLEFPMGNEFKTWNEFNPYLYQMSVDLIDRKGRIVDAQMETFGMREFAIKEKHFCINNTRLFLRGTTECSVFPLTGYPPTDEKAWVRIFEICKSYGFNHMRFHSYCPPEAAFKAADKVGIYLQVEGPSWAKYSVTLGDGKPIDDYLMEETKRIIDTYGNHPSFVMMAYGNEPSGHYVGYLNHWVDHFKKYDPQRVFTGASTGRSWAIIENSDFIVRSPPRGLSWKTEKPETLFDYRDNTEDQQRPYVTFEMGQWCAFPNFKEIEKYKGPLKARNFELFQDDLNRKNMGHKSRDFLMASGKVQASCYKQEIEAALRTPNLAGFQLLALNDFSGQGTALVGVLDAFWEEKGYIDSNEFKQFCHQVVPLVRLPKYTFTNNDTLKAGIEVSNFSGSEMKNAALKWQVTDKTGKIVASKTLNNKHIPIGNGQSLDSLIVPLGFALEASRYTLEVSVDGYHNRWPIWIYPPALPEIRLDDIFICHSLDSVAKGKLDRGENVLLLAAGNVENGKDITQYFTPVFWNTSWFRMRPPHTTGMWIDHTHPIFKDFPTGYYSDFQWWELMFDQQVMNMELFPADIQPIVQPIDTWFLNRKLSMLFEANVGKGKLVAVSCNLESNLEDRPVAKQLFYSIVQYMNSTDFMPATTVEAGIIKELFEKKERPSWNSYVSDNP